MIAKIYQETRGPVPEFLSPSFPKQFKLNNPHLFWPGMTPKALWYSSLGRYNPSQAIWGQMTKPVQGHDYGNPRCGGNSCMFNLLWISLLAV